MILPKVPCRNPNWLGTSGSGAGLLSHQNIGGDISQDQEGRKKIIESKRIDAPKPPEDFIL